MGALRGGSPLCTPAFFPLCPITFSILQMAWHGQHATAAMASIALSTCRMSSRIRMTPNLRIRVRLLHNVNAAAAAGAAPIRSRALADSVREASSSTAAHSGLATALAWHPSNARGILHAGSTAPASLVRPERRLPGAASPSRPSWRRPSVPLGIACISSASSSSLSVRRAYSTVAAASLSPEATSIPPAEHPTRKEREIRAFKKQRRHYRFLYVLVGLGAATVIGYYTITPVRHAVIAGKRITLVAAAVLACIADYKLLFRKEWDDPAVRHRDYKACHSACGKPPGTISQPASRDVARD